MSGVNIEYKGESIATIPDTGSKTLKTQGKYCEGDIEIEYVASTPVLEVKEATPTATQFDVLPSQGFDGLSKVTIFAALLGLDPDTLSNVEFGIDGEGFYYTTDVGGGTEVYVGIDLRGIYVIGGNTNA